MSTPSPERPEPPEGYRLLSAEEKTRPLPMDAMYLSSVWLPSDCRGNIPTLFMQSTDYATRTAPEAVAGEQSVVPCCGYHVQPNRHGPVFWNRLNRVVQCHKCGKVYTPRIIPEVDQIGIFADMTDEEYAAKFPEPTPPVEADKDAELARLREAKEKFFWELGQIAMSIDGQGKIEGSGWSDSHRKVLELIAIRDEAAAFTKHVGAPTFAEARDVLLRTKQQDEEKIESMFNTIKEQGKDLTAARATIAERDKRIAELVGAIEQMRPIYELGIKAFNK